MKRLFLFLTFAFTCSLIIAQTPFQFNFQAVARDLAGNPMVNEDVDFRLSILQGSEAGAAIFVESQSVQTNNFGLANLLVGTGTPEMGTLDAIDWAVGPFFLQIELDINDGQGMQLMGVSPMTSVPYALHANTADSIVGGISITETDPIFGASVANGITAIDTANWNNHTVDTDTQLDSTGVAALGYVAGAHTVEIDGSVTNELQQLTVSTTGDTLHLQNGGFVIIPGISAANTPAQLATLTTTAISNLTDVSATTGGNVTNDGGAPITQRGVCYGTSTSPTTADNTTNEGSGTGSFTSNLAGLTANTTYYVRAYATNSIGTSYGNQIQFITLLPFPEITFNGLPLYVHPTDLSMFNQANSITQCDALNSFGFTDWYLPNISELNALYVNQGAIGGFVAASYWSSSSFGATQGWSQKFSTGVQSTSITPITSLNCRCVRVD